MYNDKRQETKSITFYGAKHILKPPVRVKRLLRCPAFNNDRREPMTKPRKPVKYNYKNFDKHFGKLNQRNYRKFFEYMHDVKIPKGYVIHHIDEDRNNNSLKNLMIIEKTIHLKLHQRLKDLECAKYTQEIMKNATNKECLSWGKTKEQETNFNKKHTLKIEKEIKKLYFENTQLIKKLKRFHNER